MKIINIVALCFVMLSLSACPPPPIPPEPVNPVQAELNKNMALWEHVKPSDYTYTYKRNCFCPPEEEIIITITNGQVTAAFYSPSGTALPPENFDNLMTIEKLFQVIQKAITQEYDRLEVTYNATLGYPENIVTDPNERATDLGVGYVVSNFH
ncbi:MAG: hypothetical protein D3920_15070 [Candidatus Electrothrix sp. AW2]|jgi:hypothetical protein|nr:hypothetical protein [Candidatus Electrothrix gigas]MCI5179715.1 hypothetical protein [Candidatus Electrothrix gigas]MCI5195539.1 hypothetical protein [Candidatus Electrothrix gigas]MCI5226241.1 hypothetical protein [Candidatus Electrothrix gigas]